MVWDESIKTAEVKLRLLKTQAYATYSGKVTALKSVGHTENPKTIRFPHWGFGSAFNHITRKLPKTFVTVFAIETFNSAN